MEDLLCQMFYALYCLKKKVKSCYNAYEYISLLMCCQTFILVFDVLILLFCMGIDISLPQELDRLLTFNELFLFSMAILLAVFTRLLFYILFGRNRRLVRMLLYARGKYGRKCKWSLLWLCFSPFLLFALLIFCKCMSLSGYF